MTASNSAGPARPTAARSAESHALPEICATCGRLAFLGETVTISKAEYEALKARSASFNPFEERLKAYRRTMPKSRIPRDPEVAAFILKARETMLIGEVHAACLNQFGEARTPSRSSIHRFLTVMR